MDLSFEDSKELLAETMAAVEMFNYGARLDFAGVDVVLVRPFLCLDCLAFTCFKLFAE